MSEKFCVNSLLDRKYKNAIHGEGPGFERFLKTQEIGQKQRFQRNLDGCLQTSKNWVTQLWRVAGCLARKLPIKEIIGNPRLAGVRRYVCKGLEG